jgi:pimeloyl-ACP methyl ester carboxylesterase
MTSPTVTPLAIRPFQINIPEEALTDLRGTRPQTLYGIADSPVGLAAWILAHDARSYELIARAFAGHPGGLTRDDVLDNITLYWLTNTGISSARLYWENKVGFFDVKNISIPVAVSVFPDELYQAPRSWAERAFPNLIYYNQLNQGGHFAAWEQPELFTNEVRAAFRSLRQEYLTKPGERSSLCAQRRQHTGGAARNSDDSINRIEYDLVSITCCGTCPKVLPS